MTERTTILQEVGQSFRENGLTTAITALVGGSLAIAATVTRKAFTNEAMLERLDRELLLERERTDKQRADDRKADADRLERIEHVVTFAKGGKRTFNRRGTRREGP